MSPWVVTMDALEPFKVEGPQQDPPVLPYLETAGKNNYDIHLGSRFDARRQNGIGHFKVQLQIHVLEPAPTIGPPYRQRL